MVCEKCGKNNIKGARFCEDCGTKLENKIKKELYKNRKIVIIIGVVILLAAAMFSYLSKEFSPEATAKKFFLAVMNADVDSIYDNLDIKEGTFTSKKIFKKAYNIKRQDLINYSVASTEKSPDGLTAKVKINYTLKGKSNSESANINLIKDKKNKYLIFDNWQINEKILETVSDFEIIAPKDSKVKLEGILLDKKYKKSNEENDIYKIPELFKGKYDVNVILKNGLELEGKINITSYKTAEIKNLNISKKEEDKLQKQLPSMIEKLYEHAIEEKKFEDIKKEYEYDGADLKKFEDSYNSFMKSVSAGGLKSLKVKNVKIKNATITDEKIKVTIDASLDYKTSYKVLDKEKENSGNSNDIIYLTFDYQKGEFKLVDISSMAKFFI